MAVWTRHSFKGRPYCLAEGKDWLDDPVKTCELRQIFTPLTYSHINRNTEEPEDVKDISELLRDDTLGKDGSIRILVQGTLSQISSLNHKRAKLFSFSCAFYRPHPTDEGR